MFKLRINLSGSQKANTYNSIEIRLFSTKNVHYLHLKHDIFKQLILLFDI